MRILGLDPSLSSTGWGIIEVEGNKMKYVADGFIKTDPKMPIYQRLAAIHNELAKIIETYKPVEAAIEQVFLNDNPSSTIKLSMARGVVILAPALKDIPVVEYEPNKIKKAVVGVGKAEKQQVETMVKILLPGCKPKNNDSSDALAIAIAHFNYRGARY
ncbi:MAG: crossover junction endodeoxyribonuclease RuvC [Alphaproteobacteria bacterium]|nr:crossover junction endodeoxyribonuclease RuvC [Alphaproteobacteria bacterium]